jgi:hypothetical protein
VPLAQLPEAAPERYFGSPRKRGQVVDGRDAELVRPTQEFHIA